MSSIDPRAIAAVKEALAAVKSEYRDFERAPVDVRTKARQRWLSSLVKLSEVSLVHTPTILAAVAEKDAKIEWLKNACSKQQNEICQTLGKVLGYPWYKDDQANFPGADESTGVCVGDHVAESLVSEAAGEIERLRQRIEELKGNQRPSILSQSPAPSP